VLEGAEGFRGELLSAGFDSRRLRLEGLPPIFWINCGTPRRSQGWKLHLSSRSDRVPELLSRAAPVLRESGVPFKVAASAEVARAINNGEAGPSQVGKVLTVYSADDLEAVSLGRALSDRLKGFQGPPVDNELRLSSEAPVYARYGAFVQRTRRTRLGILMPVLTGADGRTIADVRAVPMHEVLEIACPFPTAIDSSLPSLIGERFLVVGPLAATAHSSIAVGVDLETGQTCALKTVKRHAGIDLFGRDNADRLEHEWALLSSLQDAAPVPRVVALVESEGRATLVLEHLQGRTLLEYVRSVESGRASWPRRRLRVAHRLTAVVQKLHAAGVVLGDLSPANVIMEHDGGLRIFDFEWASRVDEPWPRGSFGTEGYTAPSVLAGASPGPEHDLYSLAALFFYLASGTELSTVPQYDRLLRNGGTLDAPWEQVLGSLLSATPDRVAEVLEEAQNLLVTSVDASRPGAAPSGATSRPGTGICREAPDMDPEAISRLVCEVATSIASMAERGGGGGGLWVSRHPTSFRQSHRDLYMGDAGIGLGLLRIGLAAGRVDFIEVALAAAQRLWSSREGEILPGLFIGEAGVGLLFLSLAEITGDPLWLDRAVEVSRWVAGLEFGSPDLMHGTAGRGLFHAWVYESTSAPEDLAAALAAASHLESTLESTRWGPLWRIPEGYGALQGARYFGLAHGSAGIAYFLAELAAVHDIDTSLIERIGRSLERAERSPAGSPDWPDAPSGEFRGGVWCHGSAGIALALLRIHRVLGRESSLASAVRAAESALRRAHQIGPTQCHGIAGLIEVLLDLFEQTGAERHLLAAQRLGMRLSRYFVSDGEYGPMICSESPKVLTADFMIGSAGAAAALARLLDPRRFGYFLRSPRHAFRPVALPAARPDGSKARPSPGTLVGRTSRPTPVLGSLSAEVAVSY
jgi:serine/threonine protein kinase